MNAATADGKIYVMGGRTAGAYSTVNVTEIYDPSTNSWTTGAPLLYPVVAYASAVVNNKIYVIGGQDELFGFNGFVPFGEPAPNPTPNINVQFTQIYNPATNSWNLGVCNSRNRFWLRSRCNHRHSISSANLRFWRRGWFRNSIKSKLGL